MQIDIFATYEEANKELGLPRDTGVCGDLTPIPALDKDVNAEQFSCVVYVRKWTYDGHPKGIDGAPDLSFLALECLEHLTDDYKTDIYIYARIDGHDSQN